MKKLLAILTVFVMAAWVFPVAAETMSFTRVGIHLHCSEDIPAKEQSLTFDLRDADSNILLDSKTIYISEKNYKYADLEFSVPQYEIGKSFILHMSSGDATLKYNNSVGAYFVVQTYNYTDSFSSALGCCTDFYFDFYPARGRSVELRLNNRLRTDLALYTYPQGILISADALKSLGIDSSPTADGGLALSRRDFSVVLYPGSICAYKNGEAFNLSLEPMVIDSVIYVPVGDIAPLFGCETQYSDDGYALKLSLGYSTVGETPDEKIINAAHKTSDTDYLIWVSKSEYTVRIYQGGDGSWRNINTFPCAIGAPSTPTCEGTFKYYQYQPRWEYASYYVGPIMRFNGGYALHSTLLRYNGTDYDARVGVKISHGCVRMHPADINWMVDNIPLYSTVYVTP